MKHWSLIAYDIRDPRRLRRVHLCLRRQALAVQKSVFLIEADERRLAEILAELRRRADNREDDIRLYAIPDPAAIWAAGRQSERVANLYGGAPAEAERPRRGRWLKGLFGREAA
ncbi:CRISPR-associated endoribonuclease Cas2 [Thioflavicoccus mobilis 8321]|uniref:CRISPR-associated endoribonuclease Cas2 n=1 Tax=Thioflavicoccus mobilis 8321 TaxID=765912 RepID=L0GV00_9GAMM|nr:CRISPR-associated endonuclease Cas2 [Thioflavicoccus mobilis]AGA89195.1 CRISPR-associated endoribonuclease Cas2 [Thioflavicoccus mobilis 8321]